ncbi:MAG: hypothetical protein LBU85_03185 [Treponema sp.]|nr:hypothetical protein [Treponema sp.]
MRRDRPREVLKELAAPGLKAMDVKAAAEVKEAHEKEERERVAESAGVGLERKLRAAGIAGVKGEAIPAAVAGGTIAAPLSVREAGDGKALGMSVEEYQEINRVEVRAQNASAYETILSNLYAAWPLYAGGLGSKQEAAGKIAAGEEGLRAYFEGSRARGVDRKEVEAIVSEELAKTRYTAVPSFLVTKLEPRYRAQGGAVSFTRSTPRGSPEKIRLERDYAASGRQAIEPADEEAPVVAFERYAGKAGGTSVQKIIFLFSNSNLI